MLGIFINEDELPFATMIAKGLKPIETRTRDMLGKLVGKRVALISTGRNRKPCIVGYATITGKSFIPEHILNTERCRKYTQIPYGSKYNKCGYHITHHCKIYGKWCYEMNNPCECKPTPLPNNTTRHGRSYCEFNFI